MGAEEEGDEREHEDQGDQRLGDDAVEAPDAENVSLDVTEVNGESECGKSEEQGEPALAEEGTEDDSGVSENAEKRYGKTGARGRTIVGVRMHGGTEVEENPVHDRVRAAIDGAAIPMCIQVAGFHASRVVNVQSQSGDEDADEGQNDDQETHDLLGYSESASRALVNDIVNMAACVEPPTQSNQHLAGG
jgi:hypothetical protein